MSFPEAETASVVLRGQPVAIASYTHDKGMAADFLTTLDPAAQRFTFQFFSDGGDPYAEIFHGTLDEAWPKLLVLNTPERSVGAFVTINETDFQGRRRENVVRARALWVDADSADQVCHCEKVIHATGVVPTMVVQSSTDRAHYYWCCDDIALEDFSTHQAALIKALGTDPAVKDLPRVMRLPGTMHLKVLSRPQLVTLHVPSAPPTRWNLGELVTRLPLTTKLAQTDQIKCADSVFTPADTNRLRRLFGKQYLAHNDDLSAGIETNIAEIRSAVAAIPPSAISTEQQWMKFARALAHETLIYRGQTEALWQILDAASAAAPGYNSVDNRNRFLRYIDEASDRGQPITIASIFALAKSHGWPGWSPATVTLVGNATGGPSLTESTAPGSVATLTEPASYADPYSEFVGPRFPTSILPPVLANFVEAEHLAMGADRSALAMAALAAVGGALTSETKVQVGDAWFERPIFFIALIGDPSTMKSPVIAKATKALSKIDTDRDASWRAQKAVWDQLKAAGNAKPTGYPAKPARCTIQDATPEKTAEILARGPAGSLMLLDELAGWLANFDRYGSGASSRAFYLTAFNGGPYLKDRVGQGVRDDNAEIRVDNLALCILGGIQPDRLAGLRDLTSDGLLQRFLVVLMAPAKRGDQKHPVAAVEALYGKLIQSVHSAHPRNYIFAPDAEPVLTRVLDRLYELEQVQGFSSALIGAIGKLKGYYARLALTLEIATAHSAIIKGQSVGAAGVISKETAEAAAILLFDFLLPHTFGLYDVVANGGQDRDTIRAIGDFILASDKVRLRPSDLTAGVRRLRNQPANKIAEWAGRFCALGWLQPEDDRSTVPKAWLVDPGLRAHFAARRQQAQKARAASHDILKAGGARR